MTGHFHITGNTFAEGKVTVDGEPFPYEVMGLHWRLEQTGLPILSIDILPTQLTIETQNVFDVNEARQAAQEQGQAH